MARSAYLTLVVACVSTLVAVGLAVIVVAVVEHRVGEGLPAALVAAVSLLIAKLAFDKHRSDDKSANATVAMGAGAVVTAGALCAVAWNTVTALIADLVGSDLVGLSGLESVFFVVGLLCVTPVAITIAVLVSTAVLDVMSARFVARATLGAAVLTSTALFGLTSLALVRVSVRPSINCYLEGLHAAGVEIPVSGAGIDDGGAATFPRPSNGAPSNPVLPLARENRDTVGDVTVVHVCYGWMSCSVSVVDGADAIGIDEPSPGHARSFNLVGGQAKLVVLRVAPDLVLIKASARRAYAFPAEEVSNIVFRRVENRWQEDRFRLGWIIQRTNTPLAWINFGVAGVGLTLVLWALRLLIPLAHRGARARTRAGNGAVRRALDERSLFTEPGNELLAGKYNLLHVDAAIMAVACWTASPLIAAAALGLLR